MYERPARARAYICVCVCVCVCDLCPRAMSRCDEKGLSYATEDN